MFECDHVFRSNAKSGPRMFTFRNSRVPNVETRSIRWTTASINQKVSARAHVWVPFEVAQSLGEFKNHTGADLDGKFNSPGLKKRVRRCGFTEAIF